VYTASRMTLIGMLCLAACTQERQAVVDSATVDSVRAFMAGVAHGVTAGGPAAWRGFFVDDSTFFMASEGRLVFPSSAAASRGIDQLKQLITRIELTWADTARVDPLAPGLAVVAAPYREVRVDRQGEQVEEIGFFTGIAERRAGRWVLRDAHWSVQTPPPVVP
jgi:hypothetical protein